ncbi:TOPRIM nucleotidyl transferase/hydrolase domain-containing protein [Streptomyces sp. t39]|uniref:TOPRIM nucleotidyl transferase/hydrolase domain-containing protein n=1 Tax=Streptomyces sp. t39 TaxID=1828156 RepID=UPI0011CE862E|nr:TOPRIM nucleotidyl transferase/hydrolase domain-containing protein [Streptomyces sp. t39]TXS49926.1 ATP-dependent endonuclease [Streptomyces sp. t39]
MDDVRAFRDAVTRWAAGAADPQVAEFAARAKELAALLPVRTAVLLEGPSDVAAVETLAGRRGRDPVAEGVCVISMGGAMSVGRYADVLGPAGLGLRLIGLCDENERSFYDRALERAGVPSRDVFVCAKDLEDELVRALGTERVEEIIRAEGDLRPWLTFRRQPAQHGRPAHEQLRRFLGTKKGRKIRYGHLLVDALDPGRVPAPLDDLFASL